MKNLSVKGSGKPIISFILKVLISTAASVLLLSFAVSEIYFRLDLGTENINLISVFILAAASAVTAFVSLSGFKNNGALIGIISQVPLILFSLFNLIFGSGSAVMFFVKTAAALLIGTVIGILRVKKNSAYKV